MKHRYGRHGAGAWLRHYLKKRKNWQRSSPAIHASFSVTPIVLPGFRGKAFLVLMQDDDFDAQQLSNKDSLPEARIVPAHSEEECYIIEIAEDKAHSLLERKMATLDQDTCLSVNWDALSQWAKQEGKRVAEGRPSTPSVGYRKKLEIYETAFLRAIKASPHASRFIEDQDKYFQELVQEDAQAGRLTPNSEDRAILLIELGAIRAIKENSLLPGQLLEPETLQCIRKWAKTYRDARLNQVRWEVWPEPESDFRLDL